MANPDPAMVDDLTAAATALGLDPEDLDETVRDLTDSLASDAVNIDPRADIEAAQDEHYGAGDRLAAEVNNAGLGAQVTFLVTHLGPDATRAALRAAAGRGA